MAPTPKRGRALPRGIRNHNPGNLRRCADPWQGLAAQQTDLEFFQFVSPKWGIRALARTLITYQDKVGLRNIRQIIGRWAPPNENDTGAYVRTVTAAVGVGPEDRVNVHEYAVLRPLVLAIIKHENGQQPYTDAEIDAGLILAGVEPPQRPLSQSRTIKGARVAVGASLAGLTTETLRQVEPALPFLQTLVQVAPWVVGAAALAGTGYILWARIDDRRRGLR